MILERVTKETSARVRRIEYKLAQCRTALRRLAGYGLSDVEEREELAKKITFLKQSLIGSKEYEVKEVEPWYFMLNPTQFEEMFQDGKPTMTKNEWNKVFREHRGLKLGGMSDE